MPDYSEFPTTPTAWQEAALRDAGWEEPVPLAAEAPPVPARRLDVVSLVAGLVFATLAVTLLAGARLTVDLFHGGVLWALPILLGVLLLTGEVRRSRRRR